MRDLVLSDLLLWRMVVLVAACDVDRTVSLCLEYQIESACFLCVHLYVNVAFQ